jgi:uncharacterized lipoprotein YajG
MFMQIMRPTLAGIATVVLAGVLAAGAVDVAFAQAKDRQLESRGYRHSKASPSEPSQETAKQPYDRQMESRGYRHHRHRHHKS